MERPGYAGVLYRRQKVKGESQQKSVALECINLVFSSIFAVEAAIKIFALRAAYFKDAWNCFDCIVVCGSAVGTMMASFAPRVQSITALIQTCRVLRLVRLIKSIQMLRVCFNTMISAIPSISNIACLIGLMFFIYASIGCQLYSFLPDDGEIDHSANFRSFGKSLLLLLRFSTGEGWNSYLRSMVHSQGEGECERNPLFDPKKPWCLSTEDLPDCTVLNGCPAGISAYFYFYSFILLVSFVVMNLCIAVVLEGWQNNMEGNVLSAKDLDAFVKLWSIYDPDATWYITANEVKELITLLEPPLGLGSEDVDVERLIRDNECISEIPVNNGKCNIVPVAALLAKRLAKKKQGEDFQELSNENPWDTDAGDGTTRLKHVFGLQSAKIIAFSKFARQIAPTIPTAPIAPNNDNEGT